jgi:ABC-type multidrug transport system fused ATPase/permease subunit
MKILKLFNNSQKKNLIILIFLSFIASCAEILNLAIILPIINVFLGLNNQSTNDIFYNFFSLFNLQIENILLVLIIIFVCFLIIKAFFLIFVAWKTNNFTFNFIRELSDKLFSQYLTSDYKYITQKNSSELSRNLIPELDELNLNLNSFMFVILEIFILIGVMVFLLILNPVATIILSLSSFIFGFIYFNLIKKVMGQLGLQRQSAREKQMRFMYEGLSSIKEINIFGRKNFFINRFKKQNSFLAYISIKFNFLSQLPRIIFEIFVIFLIAIIFLYLLNTGESNNEITKFIAILFAASLRILPSIYKIFTCLQNIKYTNSSVKVIYDDINKNYLEKKEDTKNERIKINNSIELIVSVYKHNNNEEFNLQNVRIQIPKNKKIGLIGKSGSGKSTILNILTGLISSNNIKLLVDDKIINNNLNNWKKLIGIIPQNIFILNDTIKNNILFGIDENLVKNEKILETIRVSNLTTLISRFKLGINHNLNEKGTNLSGGEIQRIGIARALLNDPKILLFDEATSALDTFTENEILKEINNLKDKTIFSISHRMNTLKYCDNIYHLEDGQIIDEGNFQKFNKK